MDNAPRKRAEQHGGGQQRVDLPEIAEVETGNEDKILAVHDALEKFAAQDSHRDELVKLRYFLGMTIEEAAEVLGFSVPTAKRHWAYARLAGAGNQRATKLNCRSRTPWRDEFRDSLIKTEL